MRALGKLAHGRILVLALLSAAVLAAGCTAPAFPNLERDYGRAVSSNLAASVVNPQAGLNQAPAAGLGPTAATNLKGKYDKTFKAEEAKKMLQLTTGTGQ
jgi:hypothetical protein